MRKIIAVIVMLFVSATYMYGADADVHIPFDGSGDAILKDGKKTKGIIYDNGIAGQALTLAEIQEFTLSRAADKEVLLPTDFDMWYGIKDRIYLNGYWQLTRIRKGDISGSKPLEWWIQRLERKSELFPVPWDWNSKITPPVKQVHYFGNQTTPIAFSRTAEGREKKPFVAGLYKRTIIMPELSKNTHYFIHFEWIDSEAKVYLNGNLVGRHKNYYSSSSDNDLHCAEFFELDISSYIQKGKNILMVKVKDDGLPHKGWKGPDYGGICGPVWLEKRPLIFIKDSFLSPNISDSSLKVEFLLNQKPETPLELDIEIIPWKNIKKVNPVENLQSYRFERKWPVGEKSASFNLTVPKIRLWDTENPNLYAIVVYSKKIMLGVERFGFREFKTKDGQFLLNNKPVYLRGCTVGFKKWICSSMPIMHGQGGYLRQHYEMLKSISHVNFLRNHSGPSPKHFLAMLDELGILLNEEWSIKGKAIKKIKHSEYIREKTVDFIDKDGHLSSAIESRLIKAITRSHNHPCVVMWDSGNELRIRPAVIQYARAFYKIIKQHDRQQRPVASLGSGPHLEDTSIHEAIQNPAKFKVPTDLLDIHVYSGSLHGTSWLDIPWTTKRWYDRIQHFALDPNVPVINGETVGITIFNRLFRPICDRVNIFPIQGNTPKERLLDFIRQQRPTYHWTNRIVLLSKMGINSFASYEDLMKSWGRAITVNVETLRRDCDFLQGISTLFGLDETSIDLRNPIELTLYKAWGVGFKPIFLSLYPSKLNYIPGETMQLSLLIQNGTLSSLFDLDLKTCLKTEDRILQVSQAQVGKLRINERDCINLNLTIPKDTPPGRCSLQLTLNNGTNALLNRTYNFSILPRLTPLKLEQPLWLWSGQQNEEERAFLGALDTLKVNSTRISNFAEHDKSQPLVFPPNSFNKQLQTDAPAIRSWLEGGGRILILQQEDTGEIPFAKEYSITSTGISSFRSRYTGSPFVDMIDLNNPILKGLQPENFRNWEGKHTLYDYWIQTTKKKSIDKSVILASCWKRQGLKYGKFGMIANQSQIGKGMLLCSQVNIFSNWGDPAARNYLRNLIEYVGVMDKTSNSSL